MESTEFFGNNYNKENGIAYIIARSFYNNHISPQNIEKEDLDMCVKLSLLVNSISTKQMELLGSFLTLLTDRIDKMERSWSEEKVILNNNILNYNYCPECKCVNCLKKGTKKENIFINKNTPVRIPPLPKNSPELRFKIKDGKTSFMSLLPFAKLNELDDGHVYCLPSECIKHFLATRNIPMEFNITQPNYPIVNVNQTPRE